MEENNNNQVIVDIGLDALIASLRELQKQYEANTAAMKALRDEGKQDSDEYIQLTQANKVLRQEMNGVEKSIQNNIKAEKAQEGSLVQLRAQLANLNKQYDSMSGFERMGTAGEALRTKIKALSDNISSLEANTGRYQRNVGNYKSALEGLSGGFKAAGLSTQGLDKSLKLLNGNPIMLLLTAIVAVVRNLSQAFKNNEENLDRWKVVVAPIGRLIELASNAMQQLASKILDVVEAGKRFLSWVGSMLERLPLVGEKMREMNEEMRESIDLEKEAQELRNAHRQEEVEQAKASLESQRLLTKAYDKANYTAKERLDFLRQATKIEQDRADAAEQLAKRELELARQRASISKNDSKTNDELAQKEAAYYQALQQREALQTALKRRESQLLSQIASEEKEVARAAEEARRKTEERQRKEEEQRQEELDAQKRYEELSLSEMQKAEDALNSIIIDALEKRRAIENTAYQRKKDTLTAELEAEREAHGEGTALFDAYNLQLEALEEQHAMTMAQIKADEAAKEAEINSAKEEDAAKTAERIKQIEKSRYEYSAQIAGGLSDLMESVAGDNKEMVKASKIVALAEVAIKQGVAIAEAVAASAAGDPYTYALRVASAIASTVAAMASAIASINKASSFETGGVIGGYRGATMGADNTYIHARQGEMVLNAEQQRQLFEVANGGYSSNMMAQLVEAIQSMPAPVLDYKEFTTFQRRVTQMTENAKLD